MIEIQRFLGVDVEIDENSFVFDAETQLYTLKIGWCNQNRNKLAFPISDIFQTFLILLFLASPSLKMSKLGQKGGGKIDF